MATAEAMHCPNCGARVRVPASLVGRRVKCPSCGTPFRAEPEPEDAPEPELDEPRPARRRRPPPEEDEESEQLSSDEDWDAPEPRPRRRRRRHRNRGEALTAPAVALLIAGALGVVFALVWLAYSFGTTDTIAEGRRLKGAAYAAGMVMGSFGTAVIGGCWSGLVIAGAVSMLRRRAPGLAKAGAIAALLPCCNPLWLLGLPFGIWALVVLNRPEVQRAFPDW